MLLRVIGVSILAVCASFAEPVLPKVDAAVGPFVEKKEAAGLVTLVANKGGILHLSAMGQADIASGREMKTDDLFWIASMTKPMTATAIMILQEEGKLSLNDPVSQYLPEYKALKDKQGNPVEVTLLQCLNHTSGLSEVPGKIRGTIKTLEELVPEIVKRPVQWKPGEKWKYCQTGINTAGRVIEVVSGQSLPEFFQTRLFGPLGMVDTTFYPTEKMCERLAKTYRAGNLKESPLHFLGAGVKKPWDRDRYPMANGGLFSTAKDCSLFCRMILRGGELNGHRIIKPESVKQMVAVTTGSLKTGFTPGNGWGVGWCVNREPQGTTGALSPLSFGHGGAYGTQMWIDPVKGRVDILMVQRVGIPNGDDSQLRKSLHDAAAESVN